MTWADAGQLIYQVLHLLLQPGHGLLGADGKHKSVHVVVVESHFDLLQTEERRRLGAASLRLTTACAVTVTRPDFTSLRACSGSLTYHLITGGPHHPGQNVEEVLPLQKLQQEAASERACESATRERRRPYLELNEHAFAAHAAGAPQVIDVLVFLIQLPSARRFFTGAVVTCGEEVNVPTLTRCDGCACFKSAL